MDEKTIESRLIEVLDDATYSCVLNPANYLDPTSWMREHLKSHTEYMNSAAGATMVLPFKFELWLNGVGNSGRCVCNLCQAEFSMTNLDNW